MNNKIQLRKNRIRKKIKSDQIKTRVLVIKSLKYDSLQAIDENTNQVIAGISTKDITGKNRQEKDKKIGENFAEILKNKKIDQIIFDRSGYKYHGRIKLIAESLRKNGIKF